MGQAIPERDSGETLASVSTNPTPQQDARPEPYSSEASPGSRPLDVIPASAEQEFRKRKPRRVCRTDSGKLHRVRHGILSREALDALVQAGEDRRTLRRLERQYREALRPNGPLGNLFFDRFWASYLRLLLIGRLETRLTAGNSGGKSEPESLDLVPGVQPTLVQQDPHGQPTGATPVIQELPRDLLRDLVLVQRYDRHHSRELYRALGLLLLLRRGGEAALEDWAIEMFGAKQPRKEE
jgi:hypothetical protein